MSEYEYVETRWSCDHCGRKLRRIDAMPAGWHEAILPGDGKLHSCPNIRCVAFLASLLRDRDLPLPASLALDPCLATPGPEDQ